MKENIKTLLEFLYGTDVFIKILKRFQCLQDAEIRKSESALLKDLTADETETVLIAFGDQFQGNEYNPLKNLKNFLDKYLKGSVSGVHLLSFSPCSSDDGLSVIDFRGINPDMGTWSEIRETAASYTLMADLALNKCSVNSEWFRKFLEQEGKYKDFFITAEREADLSSVFRQGRVPVLAEFDTSGGKKLVLTSPGADRAYLNYSNPEVIMGMMEMLFCYIRTGVQFIKLDSAELLWEEEGQYCLNHEKTLAAVKLFRGIIREYAPRVIIITEKDNSDRDNLSYSGKSCDEEQVLYQSALPPLILDAFLRENASRLRKWAADSLNRLPDSVTLFNFQHPSAGKGILSAEGILNDDEIKNMFTEIEKRGGLISCKRENRADVLNEPGINYFSAVTGNETDKDTAVSKFLASQSLLLFLKGIPGIHIHNLLGPGNWKEGVVSAGKNSMVCRYKFDYTELDRELSDPDSLRSLVLTGYRKMLDVRKKESSFSPSGAQIIPEASGPLFAVLRISPDEKDKVLCMVNISGKIIKSFAYWDFLSSYKKSKLYDIITKQESGALVIYNDSGKSDRGSECCAMVTLDPWEVVWLK